MKNLLTVLIAFILFSAITPIALSKTDVTVLCDNNYPPYSYEEGKQIKGIYTKILKRAFSKMEDYNVKISAVPWKRGLKKLENGEEFALYPPYFRPDSRPYMEYSAPILEEKLVVFTTKGLTSRRKLQSWPQDFYGLTIGKNHGFAISRDKTFLDAVQKGRIVVDDAKDNKTNILKLGMGRIDVYVNDRLSILWELSRLKKKGIYDEGGKHAKIVEGPVISAENGYVGFTTRDKGAFSYKKDFIKKLNKRVKELKDSGEIEAIIIESYSR